MDQQLDVKEPAPVQVNGEAVRYDKVPGTARMREAIERHMERGEPVGHFLTALLEGDLYGAVTRADAENLALIRDWCLWLKWEAPSGSYGSPEAVAAWRKARKQAMAQVCV